MQNLEFNEESNDVVQVVSPIGEHLVLHEPVNYTKCKGQLDKFLNKLETALKCTLRQVMGVFVYDGRRAEPVFYLLSTDSNSIGDHF